MNKWLDGITSDDTFMMSSDKILTLAEPTMQILDIYKRPCFDAFSILMFQLIGNQFLVRGVDNGERYEYRDEFFPTLFVKSKKNSKYRTLSGESVEEIYPGTVRECRDFYKKYDEVEGFSIYGNDRLYLSIYSPRNILKMRLSLILVRSNL